MQRFEGQSRESNNDPLIRVEDLSVRYETEAGPLMALDSVSLSINSGETYGLVGESGAGKSTIGSAILRLLPQGGTITGGEIFYRGRDITGMSESELGSVRGNEVGMIFQEPTSSLNPVLTIHEQLDRILKRHRGNLSKTERRNEIIEVLEDVQISDPESRLDAYPVQFSGGMNQRISIAIALLCEPNVLIADEPTTNLDVTIGADILDLLNRINEEKNITTVFITHDMGIVAQHCGRIGVMYGGKKVEEGPVQTVFNAPKHPYTRDLIACIPDPSTATNGKLQTIEGNMPTPIDLPDMCYYANRCPMAQDRCYESAPPLESVKQETSHESACFYSEQVN